MKSFVFRKPFFIWLGILALMASVIFLKSSDVSTKEETKLQKLIDSSPKKQRKLKLKTSHELTRQVRWNVVKKIYIADGALRRVMQLAGSSSELTVVSKRPHLQLQETFYDVHGIMQQELFYKSQDGKELKIGDEGLIPLDPASLQPMQRFRYFEARSAIYDFHTHQLLAKDVTFWTFTAPGHEVIEKPSLQDSEAYGTASIMTVYVSSKDNIKKFSGRDLNVQFKTERGI